MQVLLRLRGFGVLGVVLAIGVLATMSIVVARLVSTNQATRTQQVNMDQAFYSSHAGFEYALKQAQIYGDSCPNGTLQFGGDSLTIDRITGKISVRGTKDAATNTFSINDPVAATQQRCLTIDSVTAYLSDNNKKLKGMVLSKSSDCCLSTISVVSIQISWTPDGNEKVKEIQIDAQPKPYHSPGANEGSGTVFTLDTPELFTNITPHFLSYVRFQNSVANGAVFTLTFNMSDGSSKSVVVTVI